MTTPLIHVIDTSSNNGPVDLAQVKAAGVDGVLIKLTEYTNYRNPYFDGQWAEAGKLGMWRAAYHFSRPEHGNPAGEAGFFLSQLPTLDTYDGLALDIETPEAGAGPQSDFALTWLARVAMYAGFPPLVYSDISYIESSLTSPALGAYPLWLAAQQLPAKIGPWQNVALWQYTWTAAVPGVPGPVDESSIARTLDGLRDLGKPPTPRVVIARCGLKPQPNHTCPSSLYLGPGVRVGAAYGPVHTDDTWQKVVVNRAMSGYVLASNLRAA